MGTVPQGRGLRSGATAGAGREDMWPGDGAGSAAMAQADCCKGGWFVQVWRCCARAVQGVGVGVAESGVGDLQRKTKRHELWRFRVCRRGTKGQKTTGQNIYKIINKNVFTHECMVTTMTTLKWTLLHSVNNNCCFGTLHSVQAGSILSQILTVIHEP